jgi:hypothetical protein
MKLLSLLKDASKDLLAAALIAAAAFVATPTAQAQTYGTITLSTVPSTIAASTTTNLGSIVDMRGNRRISILLSAASQTNSAASLVTLKGCKGLDGVNFETTESFTLPLATGTLGTTTATNLDLDIGAAGYVKFISLVISTNTCTNCSVVIALKPGS